jgi:hypothetical protein
MVSDMIDENGNDMVQRVSKSSFAVMCQPSERHPLGFLHLMFMKSSKDDASAYRKFLCTCRPFKVPVSEFEKLLIMVHWFIWKTI